MTGAAPNEVVRAKMTKIHRRHVEATIVAVEQASPDNEPAASTSPKAAAAAAGSTCLDEVQLCGQGGGRTRQPGAFGRTSRVGHPPNDPRTGHLRPSQQDGVRLSPRRHARTSSPWCLVRHHQPEGVPAGVAAGRDHRQGSAGIRSDARHFALPPALAGRGRRASFAFGRVVERARPCSAS